MSEYWRFATLYSNRFYLQNLAVGLLGNGGRCGLVVGLLACLGGCGLWAQKPGSETDPGHWSRQQPELLALEQWRVKGKFALRTRDQSESAFLLWRQQGQEYELHLSGALGLGSTKILGRPGWVLLQQAGRESRVEQSVEQLLELHLGWSLPLEQLTYWVKGLPVPGLEFALGETPEGRLAWLEQSNCRIEFQRYRYFGEHYLPAKIRLTRADTQLTLVIKDWQFELSLTDSAARAVPLATDWLAGP